jgi:tRNA nucleotidyltransferase (CCA-adding enzyme)
VRLSADLVPDDVVTVLRRLRTAGKQAFIAGGAVRDIVRTALGEEAGTPQDFDVATDALPEEVQRLFPRTAPTGIAHGTITVLAGSQQVEVTTFRGEGPYLDGRRPSSVTFLGDIEGDLARRDFTVNAIAWDPLSDDLRDPFDGVADLRCRRLRTVGDPLARFSEDGLRPLRAVRFACTLRLGLDRATEKAIPKALETFEKVAWERIRDELVKLLVRGKPASRGLRLLRRTGLLARIAPELLEGVAFQQNAYHRWDVFRHTSLSVDYAPPEPIVRLAALMHDVGKPRSAEPPGPKGDHTFYRHEFIGEELAREILLRWKLPHRAREPVALLVREHNWYYRDEWTDATVRRTIARIGPAELPALWRSAARISGREGGSSTKASRTRPGWRPGSEMELRRASALKITELAIGGREVMEALSVGPGRVVGQVLAKLLDRVLDEPELNTRERLLRLVPETAQALSTGNPQG